MEKEIITEALQEVAKKYSKSPATTNAGAVFRFIVNFIPVDVIVKAFAHKLS